MTAVILTTTLRSPTAARFVRASRIGIATVAINNDNNNNFAMDELYRQTPTQYVSFRGMELPSAGSRLASATYTT